MDRSTKETEVGDLKELLGKATTAVVTEYKGLTVAEISALRRDLREAPLFRLLLRVPLIFP
jgi:ribosomal protein L10